MVPERGTIARTAFQSGFCRLETVGDSRPGVIAHASSTSAAGHVVVEHDVVPGGDDAEQPAAQHLDGRVLVAALAADEHGLAAQDRVAEDLEALAAQRRAGLDDVGDDVGHPEGDRGLDGAVEAHDLGLDAVVGEVLLDESLVARGDPATGDVRDRGHGTGAAGIPEGRLAEAERHDLGRGAARSRAAGHGR